MQAGVFAGGQTCTTLRKCCDMICHQMMLEHYRHHLGARLVTVLFSVVKTAFMCWTVTDVSVSPA